MVWACWFIFKIVHMLVSGADLDFVVAFGLDFFGGFVCSLFF